MGDIQPAPAAFRLSVMGTMTIQRPSRLELQIDKNAWETLKRLVRQVPGADETFFTVAVSSLAFAVPMLLTAATLDTRIAAWVLTAYLTVGGLGLGSSGIALFAHLRARSQAQVRIGHALQQMEQIEASCGLVRQQEEPTGPPSGEVRRYTTGGEARLKRALSPDSQPPQVRGGRP